MPIYLNRFKFWSKSILNTYIFISEITNNIDVCTRVTNKFSLEEGYVNYRGVEINELKDENFKSQIIIKVGLSSVHF